MHQASLFGRSREPPHKCPQRLCGLLRALRRVHRVHGLFPPASPRDARYDKVRFYLPFDTFERPGTPAMTEEYVAYHGATLEFIAGRNRRMAKWVTENHPKIEVRE